MQPDSRFKTQPKHFWANVRSISEKVGYTKKKKIYVPTLSEMAKALLDSGLGTTHIVDASGIPTQLGSALHEYFVYRAEALNEYVEPRLMNADEARTLFEQLCRKLTPRCDVPMNKQKGDKKAPAYLTGITNMLIEAHAQGLPCDYAPRSLTSFTLDNIPLRTLARWVDGAFPSVVNPVAIWEIKEYYYTTTFGSRVADGVYESLLDGMELQELREHEGVSVQHCLIVDAKYTWWDCGRSYLCRLVDMLNMGYVDEVLFGREVVERLPVMVEQWVQLARAQNSQLPIN